MVYFGLWLGARETGIWMEWVFAVEVSMYFGMVWLIVRGGEDGIWVLLVFAVEISIYSGLVWLEEMVFGCYWYLLVK